MSKCLYLVSHFTMRIIFNCNKKNGIIYSRNNIELFFNNYLDGDTEPEILFVHANDHRRWRITQTIERLCFNLCFGFNLYELLVEFY